MQVPQVIELAAALRAGEAAVCGWAVAAEATEGAATPSPAVIAAAAINALILRMHDP